MNIDKTIEGVRSFMWSGLWSADNWDFQSGVRDICVGIGNTLFLPSDSGYAYVTNVVQMLYREKPEKVLCSGHSNGVFAALTVAEQVYIRRDSIPTKVYILAFDQTAKKCPPLHAVTPECDEYYAGLTKISKSHDFNGIHHFHDYSEETHIGIVSNPEVQASAIAFGKRVMGW